MTHIKLIAFQISCHCTVVLPSPMISLSVLVSLCAAAVATAATVTYFPFALDVSAVTVQNVCKIMF
jgi:hypothetical protein